MAFTRKDDDLILHVRVSPGASRDQAKGMFTDANGKNWLQVKVRAAPDKGKANKAVITVLSKLLGLPKSRFELIRGATARTKVLHLSSAGQTCEKALKLLIRGE